MNEVKPTFQDLKDRIRQLEMEVSVLKMEHAQTELSGSNELIYNNDLILGNILDTSPLGISYILESGRIAFSNKKAQEIFKPYKSDSTEILKSLKITTPDGKLVECEELIFEAVKNTKKPIFNVEHIIESNELKKIISISGSPVINKNGEYLGMIAIFEDVTDRKQSEIDRSEINEKFSTIFNTSPTAYTLYENDGRLIEVNPAFCQMTGYSHNEVIGKTTLELNLISPKENLRMQEFMNPKDGTFDNFELEMTQKDGTSFSVLLSCTIITISGKQYRLGAAIDINKTKHAEKKLIEYSQRLEIASNSAQLGIWDWNLKENTMLWDSRMFELYGIAPENFSNTVAAWENGLHPEDKQRAIDESNRALHGEKEFDTSFRIVQPNGKILFLKANAIVIRDSDGNPLRMIGINRDITEGKIAEEQLIKAKAKLEENELRLKIALRTGKAGIWDWNIVANSFFWSDEFYALFGLPKDVIAGFESWKKCLHPDDVEIATKRIQESIDNQTELVSDYRIILPTSEIRWIRAVGKSYYENYKPIRMVGISSDITESKIAEETIRQSEDNHRRFMDESTLGIRILTKEGKTVYTNNALLEIYGFKSPEEFKNTPTADKYTANEYSRHQQRKIMRKKGIDKPTTYEIDIVTKSAQIKHLEVIRKEIIWDNSLHYQVIYMDITQRKQTEELLNQKTYEIEVQNEEYRQLNEELYKAKIVSEENEHILREQKEEIELNNERLESLLRISQYSTNSIQELLDFALEESIKLTKSKIGYIYFYNENTQQFTLNTWSKEVMAECKVQEPQTVYDLEKTGLWGEAVRQRKPIVINNYNEHNNYKKGIPEGHVRLDNFLTIPVIFENKIVAVAGVANKEIDYNNSDIRQLTLLLDNVWKISERINLIDDLKKAKNKAEESDKLKTAFLHNISHEIRTPMNAIIGFSELLTKPGTPPEKGKYYADIVNQSCNQLLMVISDIVNIATIEAGLAKIEVEEFNINSVIKFVHQQFVIKAENLKINLTNECNLPDEEAVIKCDKTKFSEILINLIGNAFKFTKHGTISFGYRLVDNFIEFFVKDTGIGIPKELFDEIFFRFRQVEYTTTRQYGGSGLGLSISKAYVELLGGKIWLMSEPEKGSTFFFTIPYILVQKGMVAKVKIEHEIKLESLKAKTILIAEDEDSNFMLLEEILSVTDWKIIRAMDGVEAVDFCRENADIDLVLMDLKMPIMDGYEATKQIKTMRPELKIMAQTAYASENDKNKAIQCGCVDVITKPINEALFLLKIEEILAGND
jgi:PAS domain S-box-containing protein